MVGSRFFYCHPDRLSANKTFAFACLLGSPTAVYAMLPTGGKAKWQATGEWRYF